MTKYKAFHVPKRQINTGRKWICGCPVMENEEEGALWSDENVLKLDCGDVC